MREGGTLNERGTWNAERGTKKQFSRKGLSVVVFWQTGRQETGKKIAFFAILALPARVWLQADVERV